MSEAVRARVVPVEIPEHLVKIQCITDLRPWAELYVNENGEWKPKTNPIEPEPLLIDQVAVVQRDRAFEKMKRARHIVEIR